MDWPLLLLLIVAGLLFIFLIVYLVRQVRQIRDDFQSQVTQLQQSVSQRFDANVQTVSNHLGIITNQITNTTNVVSQVEGKLGQMHEAARQIFDLGKQVSSLQDILQSPKMRGGWGETLLSDLLSQSLPAGQFKLQHRFSNGTIVDAVLLIGNCLLPVDSKFPLENFRRFHQTESELEKKNLRKLFLSDVRKHINDIADKYILPDQNTFDFALMFIPAENVYYELIVRDESNIYEHSLAKKVIPVSPNTFYAYLQVISLGFRGYQISVSAKQILAQLQQVGNDLARLEGDFQKVGVHLRDAQSSFNRSDVRFQKLRQKVTSLGSDQAVGDSAHPLTDEEQLEKL